MVCEKTEVGAVRTMRVSKLWYKHAARAEGALIKSGRSFLTGVSPCLPLLATITSRKEGAKDLVPGRPFLYYSSSRLPRMESNPIWKARWRGSGRSFLD
jgi:hypothetical protein